MSAAADAERRRLAAGIAPEVMAAGTALGGQAMAWLHEAMPMAVLNEAAPTALVASALNARVLELTGGENNMASAVIVLLMRYLATGALEKAGQP